MQIGIGTSVAAISLGGPGAPPSAPVNLAAPVVSPPSGNVGDVLTATNGSWAGIPTPSFTYKWFLNGVQVPGETTNAITAVSTDDYACEVTATNSEGTADALSGAVTIASAAFAPMNISAPTVSPSSATVDDQVFTRVAGTYTGSPTPVVSWVWRKGTTPIAGTANQASYAPEGAGDVGADYNVYETATNSQGSINIASADASASLRSQATLALQDQNFDGDTGNQTYDIAPDTTAHGNSLTHSLVSPPAGVAISGSVITIDTSTAPIGTQAITVRATDEYNRQTTDSFDLQISDAATGLDPLAELTGLLPAGAADFTDPSQWPASADYSIAGGRLTFDNTTNGVNVLSDALTANILEGRHYAVFADVSRRDGGSLAWRGAGVSGGAQSGTGINAARRLLDSFVANRDIDEFGVRGTPFNGDVDFLQVYDITDEIDGELDIHILAGQSNMAGSSATTGFDTLTEEIERRALSISGTEQSAFKFHTDETGQTINAALGSKDGIGLIRGGMIEPVTHSSPNFEGVSPATSIANVICDASANRPIFACLASGGTDLFDQWDHTGTGTGENYDLMVANVDHVRGLNAANKVKTFFWCQGESSSYVGYAAQFKAMIDTLRAAWGDFPVVIMEHGGNPALASHMNMKAEQQKLATGSGDPSELSRCIYVPRPASAVLEADNIHFTGTSNRLRGTQAAQAAVAEGFLDLPEQAHYVPVNTAAPVVSPPSGLVGAVLNTTPGTWTANPTPSFSYQWQLNGIDVPDATDPYVTTDAPGDWTCIVTATNSEGSAAAASNVSTETASAEPEFVIQHFSPDVPVAGGTQPIATVGSLDTAFIVNNNSIRQGSGPGNNMSNLAPCEGGLGLRLTAANSVRMDREPTATLVNQSSFSIWEYIGSSGGANAFVVRDRRRITLSSSDIASFTPSGVASGAKCVPFITGARSNRPNSSNWDHALAGVSINRATGEVSIEGRGGAGTLTVEITTVEFTGSNWTIHYATENNTSSDSGTLALSGSVGSWDNAWILGTFAKNGGGQGGLSDIACIYKPGGALNQVDFEFHSDHVGVAGQRHTVFVLENPEMRVTRYQDSLIEPLSNSSDVDVSGLGLTASAQALLNISTTVSGTGSAHARGIRGVRFVDENTVRHFTQHPGNDLDVELQVIELPNVGEAGPIDASIPVPDGPVGFGRNTTGGTTPYTVTSLADSGAGTLREGASLGGRNITFAVNGTINLSTHVQVANNTTIDGRGANIRITDGWGLRVNNRNNIIIRNLKIDDTIDDCIQVLNATNIWIDHCTVEGPTDGQTDGTIDVSDESSGITISWCKYANHAKTQVIGNSNSKPNDVNIRVTAYNNWYSTVRRNPLIRYARVHMFNNLFKDWGASATSGDCVTATYNCQLHLENNVFDAGANKTGVRFASPGFIEVNGNVNSTGNWLRNGALAPSRNAGSVFDPGNDYAYTAVAADAALQTLIENECGWQPASFY